MALQWDCSAFFYHWATARKDREYMGCTLGQTGPLGGRFFVWNACPMGASTSPWVAAAMAFCLSKRWRTLGLRFLWYVDDIILFCKPSEAARIAEFIEGDLEAHGLLKNPGKSFPEPRKRIVGLGIDILLDDMIFRVPQKKRDDIAERCRELTGQCRKGERVHVRELASVVGKIMATHVAVGDVARLMTRDCYAFIAELTGVPPDATRRDLRIAWDTWAVLPLNLAEELEFFAELMPGHLGSAIHPSPVNAAVVTASDVGDRASGGFLDVGDGQRLIARTELLPEEIEESSTAREMLGAEHVLEAFEHQANAVLEKVEAGLLGREKQLCGRRILLFLDNRAAVLILTIGSKKPALQAQARAIHRIAMRNQWILCVRWQRRSSLGLQPCDNIGKLDDCDFQLQPKAWAELQEKWDVEHDTDCFATNTNALTKRFYSRFACKGAAAIDAFAVNWDAHTSGGRPDNWAHPPHCMIAQTVRHMQRCGARGTILVPLDRSAMWWPLVAPGARGSVRVGSHWLRHVWRKKAGLLLHGGAPMKRCRNHLVAVRLDFHDTNMTRPSMPTWVGMDE